jgi:hypothetical protein
MPEHSGKPQGQGVFLGIAVGKGIFKGKHQVNQGTNDVKKMGKGDDIEEST